MTGAVARVCSIASGFQEGVIAMSQMRHRVERASGWIKLGIGVAVALTLVPLGASPANARSGNDALLQLAQAGPGAKAAPAAPGGGSEVDHQIADLKKQLKITPQQEPQFNAFAEVMRNNAKELDAVAGQAGPQSTNAVEELKGFQQFTETQAAGLKRLVPALQALYDTLSDPQKKVADQVMGGGGPGGGPGGAPGGGPPAKPGGRPPR
jgi:protein CpxP